MNPDSQKLVRDLLLTGAIGGTGIGLVRNLIKHQKFLQQQAQAYERIAPSEEEEDATKKQASPLAQGLGVTGAVALGLGANHLVDKAYRELRRKELVKLLGDAEEAYAERLLAEAEAKKKQLTKRAAELATTFSGSTKSARTPDMSDALSWLLFGSIPLAALGTGVFAHRMLDKTFAPTPGVGTIPLKANQLPAIVRKRQLEDEESEKTASWLSEEDEVFCHALGTVCAFQKAGSIRDFVKALAVGRGDELEATTRDYGFETALDLCKGAGAHQIDGQRFAMALVRAVKTASWRPQLMLLTAAEIFEHAPAQVKLAGLLDEDFQDQLLVNTALRAKFARLEAFDALTGQADAAPDAGLSKLAVIDDYCKSAATPLPRRSDIPMYDAAMGSPSEDSHPQEQTEQPDALAQPPTDLIDLSLAGAKKNNGTGSVQTT